MATLNERPSPKLVCFARLSDRRWNTMRGTWGCEWSALSWMMGLQEAANSARAKSNAILVAQKKTRTSLGSARSGLVGMEMDLPTNRGRAHQLMDAMLMLQSVDQRIRWGCALIDQEAMDLSRAGHGRRDSRERNRAEEKLDAELLAERVKLDDSSARNAFQHVAEVMLVHVDDQRRTALV